MFIIDQLRVQDYRLRWVAVGVLAGLGTLLLGLWWVQIFRGERYQESQKDQLYRTVRLPAVRGKILDRNGVALAENRPLFEVHLYLEELRAQFRYQYTNQIKPVFLAANPTTRITRKIGEDLERQARFAVISNYSMTLSQRLGLTPAVSEARFQSHYLTERTLPFPLAQGLSEQQVARFYELCSQQPSLAMHAKRVRYYPYGTSAAHILGQLQKDDTEREGEEYHYQFRLPDFKGVAGLEMVFDSALRGRPGVRLVTVNSMAYRQAETELVAPTPGSNVVLTIDWQIQQKADAALRMPGPKTRGAVVVMDVNSGDILALASAPTFDLNSYTRPEEWAKLFEDPEAKPFFNRATQGRYLPGSIFKIVISLAGLESGEIDPKAIFESKDGFSLPGGHWEDTAGPGKFDFRKAFALSSNPYFQTHGLGLTAPGIIDMGRRLGLGQTTGVLTPFEVRLDDPGYFPKVSPLIKNSGGFWRDGDTANLSIGQGEVIVTPLQMAVLLSAVANGGKVLQPRLVMRIESAADSPAAATKEFPAAQVRSVLHLKPSTWETLHQAMLDDVEYVDPETRRQGSGWPVAVRNLQIAGKTGTAENQEYGRRKDKTTWFVSYAPYVNPRYAVIVVVEDGVSGARTCAPIAREIYKLLLARDPRIATQSNN